MVEDNRTPALKLDTLRPKDIYDHIFALSNKKCQSKTDQDSRLLYACVEGRRSCIWGEGWGGVQFVYVYPVCASVICSPI